MGRALKSGPATEPKNTPQAQRSEAQRRRGARLAGGTSRLASILRRLSWRLRFAQRHRKSNARQCCTAHTRGDIRPERRAAAGMLKRFASATDDSDSHPAEEQPSENLPYHAAISLLITRPWRLAEPSRSRCSRATKLRIVLGHNARRGVQITIPAAAATADSHGWSGSRAWPGLAVTSSDAAGSARESAIVAQPADAMEMNWSLPCG